MALKILVIRFSSIGDIVLTTPVLRVLHMQLGAEVHFLTKAAFAPIVSVNPHVTRVITLGEDFGSMLGELREQQYDHVLDLHHNLRTQRIRLALHRPFTAFSKLNFEKWLLTRFGINRLPDQHIVERYLAAASSLNIRNDGEGLDFFIPRDQQVDTSALWALQPDHYVSIVIGAAHQTKCLTVSQIAGICDQLHLPVILLGGKAEAEKAQAIQEKTNNSQVINACGQLNILQSASVLDQSGPIITHDTGLMHIAAALRKPQVVVWGNTIPGFGMYPYYGSHPVQWINIESNNLKCRPCSKLGHDICPKGHFKCILNHDPAHIASSALSLIESQ